MDRRARINEQSNFSELWVDAYLLSALNTSPKDRAFILRVETQLLALFRGLAEEVAFEELNSYLRMLVHRVARYYDLERTADSAHRTVKVWAPSGDQPRPLLKLADLVEPAFTTPPERDTASPLGTRPVTAAATAAKKVTIMKRADPMQRPADLEPGKTTAAAAAGTTSSPSAATTTTRTLEERERAYEEARQRIFDSFQALELSDRSGPRSPVMEGGGGGVSPAADEGSSAVATRADPGDVIHFGGWKDIDSIKPFIPDKYPPAVAADHHHYHCRPEATLSPESRLCPPPSYLQQQPTSSPPLPLPEGAECFDFASVWIPQHIFVVRGIPTDKDSLKLFKGRCKRRHCRYHGAPGATSGILLFTYRVGDTEEQLQSRFGVPVEAWRPSFLPEPATL